MVSNVLIPTEWLAAVGALSRPSAVLAMALSLSMLALGLRGYRWYLLAACGALAWVLGVWLARLMHVRGWYVALPAVLLLVPIAWPRVVARRVMPLLIGFFCGCAVGTFFGQAAHVANFWLGFGVGAAGGTALGLLAERFMRALFFACAGSLGFVASLGAVVRAPSGLFAPRAYEADPLIFAIVGVVLVAGSMVAQAALDPDQA